jgi:hypothetical protein
VQRDAHRVRELDRIQPQSHLRNNRNPHPSRVRNGKAAVMNIPGYDAWKLASPDDDRDDQICPMCGAYSSRSCELLEESGGVCPWEESQPDADYLRDRRDDARSAP